MAIQLIVEIDVAQILSLAIPRSPESHTPQAPSTTVEFNTFRLLVVTRGDINYSRANILANCKLNSVSYTVARLGLRSTGLGVRPSGAYEK